MEHYICEQCGTQYAETMHPPETCRICTDDGNLSTVASGGTRLSERAPRIASGNRWSATWPLWVASTTESKNFQFGNTPDTGHLHLISG
jgi:hypothetical protein